MTTTPRQPLRMATAEAPQPWPLCERLRLLFETVRAPDGSEYGAKTVCETIRTRYGEAYAPSIQYLCNLRDGQRDNPSAKVLWGLSRFFGMPQEYFTGEPTQAMVDLALRASLGNETVRQVALRMAKLPARRQTAVLTVVDAFGSPGRPSRASA